MRTDPDGANTLAFLEACLRREGGSWRDLSADLGLASGQYRLFIRQAPEADTEPLPRPGTAAAGPSTPVVRGSSVTASGGGFRGPAERLAPSAAAG
jgi:hypothetical protein